MRSFPLTGAGNRRVVQMEVKVIVVKALPKGMAPARSGYFAKLIEGLGEKASFAAYFELETLEGDVEFLSQGG